MVNTNPTATTWQGATPPYGGITSASSIAYGNGLWVVVGQGSLVAISINGINWYAVPSSSIANIYNNPKKVAYGNGLWVVCSGTSGIAYSTSGTSWTQAESYNILNDSAGVAYGKNNLGAGLWVAVGGNGVKIAYSTNGSKWYAAPVVGTFNSGTSVAYGNGMWIATGNGGVGTSTISKSTDGTNWVDATDIGGLATANDVVYGDGKWIVAGIGSDGYSRLVTSTNGLAWSFSGYAGLGLSALGIAFKS